MCASSVNSRLDIPDVISDQSRDGQAIDGGMSY